MPNGVALGVLDNTFEAHRAILYAAVSAAT